MTVAVELDEPPPRRPGFVADDGAPALHAHGWIGVIERQRQRLDAPRVERHDLGSLEPGAQAGQGARVHGLDDDTIRACVPS